MNLIYPVIFTETNDKKSTVLVYIPDLQGTTEGYGMIDAFNMAKDYIGSILFDKSDYPKSSAISDVKIESSPFYIKDSTILAFVELNIDEYRLMYKSKNVRRNITLPQWLDEMATKSKINVSAVTQEALKQKLFIMS